MLSDLHFDPYRDPAKVPALRAAPVMQWTKILNEYSRTLGTNLVYALLNKVKAELGIR